MLRAENSFRSDVRVLEGFCPACSRWEYSTDLTISKKRLELIPLGGVTVEETAARFKPTRLFTAGRRYF